MREFHSFAEAARHLTSLKLERQHGVMDAAAAIIQKEAKAIIGNYQDAEPPFDAWAPLADATKQDRVAKGYTEDDPLLRSGELRESIKRAAAQDMAVIGSAEDKAVYQELGTAKIPARSFLGIAAMRKGEEVANLIGHGVLGMLVGNRAYVRKLTPPE